jgi:hypothetical protein
MVVNILLYEYWAAAEHPGAPGGLLLEYRHGRVRQRDGATVGELLARAAERLYDEATDSGAEYVARRLDLAVWDKVSSGWLLSDAGPIPKLPERIDRYADGLRALILRDPTESALTWAGLPANSVIVFGDLAGSLAVPTLDHPVSQLKTIIEVGGIVLGTLTGNPLLVAGCVKALTHDVAHRALVYGFKTAFRELGTSELSMPRAPGTVAGLTTRKSLAGPSSISRPSEVREFSPIHTLSTDLSRSISVGHGAVALAHSTATPDETIDLHRARRAFERHFISYEQFGLTAPPTILSIHPSAEGWTVLAQSDGIQFNALVRSTESVLVLNPARLRAITIRSKIIGI